MSDPTPTKSDSDISSNSSWDVINESDDSTHHSLDDLFAEEKLDSLNVTSESYKDVIEDTFITIPEVEVELEAKAGTSDLRILDESSDRENISDHKKHGTKRMSRVKGRKKSIAKSLSSLSIIASVLTFTGISLLCLFLPDTNKLTPVEELQKEYLKLSEIESANFKETFNKTFEIFDVPQRDEIFRNIQQIMTDNGTLSEEEICTVEDEYNNITKLETQFPAHSLSGVDTHVIDSFKNSVASHDETARKPNSRRDLRNRTMSLINGLKKNLMNPRLHILLCTVMKDLYLLKLIKDLDGSQSLHEKSNNKVIKKKIKKDVSKKLKEKVLKKKGNITKMKKPNKLTTFSTTFPQPSYEYPQPYPFTAGPEKQPNTKFDNENGKSECERRFQELDYRWESVGQNHRQKIQQIKEKFKNELHQIRENEKDFPARKERMKLIREIYIQRLKNDRERYLYHLTRLRNERHKILNDICRRKKADMDSKDASVGNYAILLPGTYDFQQRLENIRNKEYPKQLDVSSFVTSSIPSMNPEKSKVFNTNTSSHSILEGDGTYFSQNQTWKNYYKERTQDYYGTKNKYLYKKAKKTSSSKDIVDEKSRTAFDSVQENVAQIPTTASALVSDPLSIPIFHENISQNPTATPALVSDPLSIPIFHDPVLENSLTENGENSGSEAEPLLEERPLEVSRKRKNKKEMYDLLFDEDEEKIKGAESTRRFRLKNNTAHEYQLLSRQDPKTVPKKIILFKGRL